MREELKNIFLGLAIIICFVVVAASYVIPVVLLVTGVSLWIVIPVAIPCFILICWMIGSNA